MAARFERENLIVTLCLKGRVPVQLPGYGPPRPELRQVVEISLRDHLGNWHQTEMPAEDFRRLIYLEVFPALTQRLFKKSKS